MKKPELLSPIQDMTSLASAIDGGADAVFFGVTGFNMRANAKNFSVEDIAEVVEVARSSGVKVYLALNTIVYDSERLEMQALLLEAKRSGVDAVICWDLSVIAFALSIDLPVHVSTQASIANTDSARFYKNLGAERIVLARECSLEQICTIKEAVDIEVEAFIHGAMCVSISGRCFMSQFTTCHSANRGECRQPCRRNYLIKDIEGEYEFEVGKDYVLSAKDLCTLPFIEELVYAGIDCFKIEGRNKSAEYVKEVTSVYREVVDMVWDGLEKKDSPLFLTELQVLKKKHMENLLRVFTRGFSSGFYLGKPIDEWTKAYGNVGSERKVYLGEIQHVYKKIGVAEFTVNTKEKLCVGDEVYVQGGKTGTQRGIVKSMEIEGKKVKEVVQGQVVAIQFPFPVRVRDTVSRIDSAKL